MKKEALVIMLPTENKSPLAKCIKSGVYVENAGDLVVTGTDTIVYKSNDIWQYQHLYFTSDEEIKEGDWFYHINLKKIFKCCEASKTTIWANNKEIGDVVYRCKKIIATTDKSLNEFTCSKCRGTGNRASRKPWLGSCFKCEGRGVILSDIPQIQQSFIQEYCRKGGIDKVMVDYEEYGAWINRGQDFECTELKLKVNQDNTINIFSVKNSWSREEVKSLILSIVKEISYGDEELIMHYNGDFREAEKWINKHL